MTATRSSLLSRIREFDDSDSWAEFDRLYRPMLKNYAQARGLDPDGAEEIAQQCMAVLVERIRRFQRNRSFRGWLRGMVEHKVADYYAERRKNAQGESDVLLPTPNSGPVTAELWQRHWDQTHVQYLMDELRSDFAEHTLQAFELYVLHGYPVEQISRMLGMTANQVYVAKSRVLSRLREPPYASIVESFYEARR